MKSDYALFTQDIKNTLENYFNKISNRVMIFCGLFIVAFAGYFEYMRIALDRVNEDRVARLEKINIESHNRSKYLESIISGALAEIKGAHNKNTNTQNPSPILKKTKKPKKK